MAIIARAWESVSGGADCIPINQVFGSFGASTHPKVLSGERSEQEIFREFVRAFEGAADQNGMISWQRFADYYAGVSASVPYNDDYFVQMLEQAWRLTEVRCVRVSCSIAHCVDRLGVGEERRERRRKRGEREREREVVWHGRVNQV